MGDACDETSYKYGNHLATLVAKEGNVNEKVTQLSTYS